MFLRAWSRKGACPKLGNPKSQDVQNRFPMSNIYFLKATPAERDPQVQLLYAGKFGAQLRRFGPKRGGSAERNPPGCWKDAKLVGER